MLGCGKAATDVAGLPKHRLECFLGNLTGEGKARMARRIPHVVDGVLHAQEPPGAPRIAVDSPAWEAWLEDRATHSFSFEGPAGTFTARKERRSGGDEEYWTAYRKRGGKLRKVYIGKAEKLTLARLEDTAAALTGHGETATASIPPDETAVVTCRR